MAPLAEQPISTYFNKKKEKPPLKRKKRDDVITNGKGPLSKKSKAGEAEPVAPHRKSFDMKNPSTSTPMPAQGRSQVTQYPTPISTMKTAGARNAQRVIDLTNDNDDEEDDGASLPISRFSPEKARRGLATPQTPVRRRNLHPHPTEIVPETPEHSTARQKSLAASPTRILAVSSFDDAQLDTSQIAIPSSQTQEMEASLSQIRSLPSLKSRTETEEMIVPSSQSQEALLTPSVPLELIERRKLLQAPPEENVGGEVDRDVVPTSQSQIENDMTFADALQQRDSLQKMDSLSSLSTLTVSASNLDEDNVPPPPSGPKSRRTAQDLQRTDSNGSMIVPMSDIDIESLFENGDTTVIPHLNRDNDTIIKMTNPPTILEDDLPSNPSQATSATESESGDEDWWRHVPPRTAMAFASPSQKRQSQRTAEKDEEIGSPHARYSPSQRMRSQRTSRDDEEHGSPRAGYSPSQKGRSQRMPRDKEYGSPRRAQYSPSQKRSGDDEEVVLSPNQRTHGASGLAVTVDVLVIGSR
ncbi:hypothetical protein Moror_10799 [Moniliophthora roreri MCA 2997]|uniref:Uncharacterized protein n=1 Tax=Moniliophthora roreri (strain MCA 2997) TaxID=1381753 RepID=V2WME1_MONRO|nr:hypothetical protein Moror_10799 [Moniliophthora roreri MCA 2997]